MKAGIGLIVTILVICNFEFGATSIFGPIDGGIISSLRIAHKLCKGGFSEEVAAAFFHCYNQSPPPGIQIFTDCQMKNFGITFSTVANIAKGCRELPLKFIPYAVCISKGFKNSGLDVDAAATKINICEAEVLGVE